MEEKDLQKLRRLKRRNWVAKNSPHRGKKHKPKTIYRRAKSQEFSDSYWE